MKKKLIALPGIFNSPFFSNELPTIQEKFDEVYVISYPSEKNICNCMAKEYGIRYEFVNYKISIDIIKKMYYWFSSSHVQEELKKTGSISIQKLKRIIYMLYYGLFSMSVYGSIKNEIEDYDGEVYLYAFWLSRPSYAIALFAGHPKVKKIFARAHRYDLYEYRNSVKYLPFRTYIYKKLNFISFISHHGECYYRGQIDTKGLKEKVAESKLSYLGTYNKKNLKKLVVGKEKIVIVSCSNIIPVKRIDLIIEILASITSCEVKWIHYGTGKLENQVKKCAEHQLKAESYCFKGYIENQKLLDDYILEDADFFINMSDSEGLPVSFMEAMSVGIPVIARDVGGNSEIVENGCGLLLDKNKDIGEIKKIVEEFVKIRVNNVEKYKEYSNKAIEKWRKNFSAEVNYNKFFSAVVQE